MNLEIEKIENGFIVTMGLKRHHATCAEEICGLTSQWVLDTCEALERKITVNMHMGAAMIQPEMPAKLSHLPLLSEWPDGGLRLSKNNVGNP